MNIPAPQVTYNDDEICLVWLIGNKQLHVELDDGGYLTWLIADVPIADCGCGGSLCITDREPGDAERFAAAINDFFRRAL